MCVYISNGCTAKLRVIARIVFLKSAAKYIDHTHYIGRQILFITRAINKQHMLSAGVNEVSCDSSSCLYIIFSLQNSLLASLYSSMGSVMEVGVALGLYNYCTIMHSI